MLKVLMFLLVFALPAGAQDYTINAKGYIERLWDKGDHFVLQDGPLKPYRWGNTSFGKVTNGVRTVRSHGGGLVIKHMYMIQKFKHQPTQLMCDQLDFVSLVFGCTSAATYWLGKPNTCIGKNSVFNFHGVTFYGFNPTKEQREEYVRLVSLTYPKEIREVYINVWSKENLHKETGRELKETWKIEVPYCKE